MALKHGALENLVLNVVWTALEENGRFVSVHDIQDGLNRLNIRKKWAYTTVKTVLDRLTTKGFINRVKTGKKYLYTSLVQREELAQKAIKNVAKEFFQGNLREMLVVTAQLAELEERTLVHVIR